MGSAQNPDIFFQAREACNQTYDDMPAIVQEYMDKVNEKLGTNYKLFNYIKVKWLTHSSRLFCSIKNDQLFYRIRNSINQSFC